LLSALKIVFVTSRFPYPIEKGDKLRAYHQLQHLHSRGHQIVLISLYENSIVPHDYDEIAKYTTEIHTFKQSKWNYILSIIKHIGSNTPFSIAYFYNKTIASKITTIIKKVDPDIIYSQLIRTTEYTKDLPYPKVLDYMDSFSLGMEKRMQESKLSFLYNIEYQRIKVYEKAIYHKFDKCIFISQKDEKSVFNFPNDKISIVPNGVDTNFFQTKNATKKYDICFVGNLGYYPNIMACRFLIEKIYPLLVIQKLDIKILIAGARPTLAIQQFANENITVQGWVDDIRDAYDTSRLFVAPLFWGSGQQNKILEAMSMQLPCITTQIVNDAIGATEGKEIFITENAADFATLILAQLDNNTMGFECRKFVTQKYSWAASIDILEKELIDTSTLK
jgi:polysaccharide biosynthesis protein PslH